jgi:hypothetical protein
MYWRQLAIEAFVVAVIFAILYVLFPVRGPAGIFVLAACGHLLFEASGANRWYCTNGAACAEKN